MSLKAVVRQKIMETVIKRDSMSLKAVVGQKIMETVIASKKKSSGSDWRVLIVDSLSMRMISSCCKMHELAEMGITLVEDINKKRQPLPHMDAVYLVQPTEASVNGIVNDFTALSQPKYKAAHVFFTEACPDEPYNLLVQSSIGKYVKALTEVNIAFLPLEAQVYSLDSEATFALYFQSQRSPARQANLEQLAQQLATLCATLGEYPSVRYRSDCEYNYEFADMVKRKLDAYKAEELSMGRSPEKARSQLLILDRGFDAISPLLHELTLQAMAYDLLPIENDVYKYEATVGENLKEVLLDENDELWVELRHQHIAKVLNHVTKSMKKFVESKRGMSTDKASMRDLGQMIKKMPQHQKELSKYSTHLHLAEECMKSYTGYVDNLCKVEQDLVMGADSKGEKIRDYMRLIVSVMLDQNVTPHDKLRLFLIYLLVKNGTTQENVDKLIQHANIAPEHRSIITSLTHLGHNVVTDSANSRKKPYQVPRKERITEETYQVSRWTPVLKDIVEDAIELKLDERHYPFLPDCAPNAGGYPSTASTTARYGRWHKAQGTPNVKNVPRLIVFVVGGMTYSEMRVAYEVTNALKNWEVIIGSDQLITPVRFLKNLSKLAQQ